MNLYDEVLETLRNMDPDEVVDYLGIDTDELVDNLLNYIEGFVAGHSEEINYAD